MNTSELFATHPVFSLEEATRLLAPRGGRAGTVERLKHHVRTGRVKVVTRGVYAVVPAGVPARRFNPDPVLVAAAARPDAVFAYHAALELLGVAHSVFASTVVFTTSRRRSLSLGGHEIRFLADPGPLSAEEAREFGTRRLDRGGRVVQVTGPERTLVEGFRRPGLMGGPEEHVVSAAGFPVLDLELLEEVLGRYDVAGLWAATGWFLERFQVEFHVPEEVLARFERRRPKGSLYLERGRRGGVLVDRWNLIMPESVMRGEADDVGER